jgi:hypothetical protein
MNFPTDHDRGRVDLHGIRSDLRALSDRSKQNLPTIDQTAQHLRRRDLRKSQEGISMKLFHSLKTHRAAATVLGIAVIAAILVVLPISYTRTIGYRATLEVSAAGLVDIDQLAAEFGKALGTDDLMVRIGAGGAKISADLPFASGRRTRGMAESFANALRQRGVPATAAVEAVTERVTGNVYAMAANGIIEIRVNSEGMTDEEIEGEIRAQLEAAGLEACLVDVQTGEGEKRIEIGIEQEVEGGCGETTPPVKITIDGREPPDAMTRRAIELHIDAAGKTPEEAEAEAIERLKAIGMDDLTDLDIEDCGTYYRVRATTGAEGPLECGDRGAVLDGPRTESKTLSEIKKDFAD